MIEKPTKQSSMHWTLQTKGIWTKKK